MNVSSRPGSRRSARGTSETSISLASHRRMLGYLRRLATTGAAYQAADVVSRVFAVLTLPLYTRYLTKADYGVAETLVAGVVLLSIPLRLGLSDAFVRFWYVDDDA